jgi:hypothetical protein
VQLWYDGAKNPSQVAVARYFDGVKQTETTFAAEPFESSEELLARALTTLAEYATLF